MNKIIVIVGPTGVGKTKLSIELAKAFNGEIINADSMQVYKDLNIGTAKIKDMDKENIPHHLIDIKDPSDDYSVFDYQRDGRNVIADIIRRGKTPIVVGGTGLYIKALLYDYKFQDEGIKNNYENLSNEEIYNRIVKIDPSTKIHLNNRQRLVRTLNKIENNSYTNEIEGNNLLYDAIFIGLTMNREELYNRIDSRVDAMFDEGLLNEVKTLYDRKIRSKAINTGIGYKELYQYFDGIISFEECIKLIKQNSRHYAKRQYTWFNHQLPVHWFNSNINHFSETIKITINYIKEALL